MLSCLSSPKFEWRQWSPNVHCGSDQVRNGRTDLHLFVRAISLLPVTHHHHLSEQIPCPSVRGFFPNPARPAACQPRTRIRASEVPSHLVREKGACVQFFRRLPHPSHRYSKAVGPIFCKPRAKRYVDYGQRNFGHALTFPLRATAHHAPCSYSTMWLERHLRKIGKIVTKLLPNWFS